MSGKRQSDAVPPHYPARAPIDAYGNGGFRFAGMSHAGSLLLLPSGIHAWSVRSAGEAGPEQFGPVLAEAEAIDFLLFGTGVTQVMPSDGVAGLFADAGIGLEPMNTGAACRTYNLLLAENRAVAAALIAVD
ncbi:MAG: MTH938/NDUFAF3 family protein [Pseudomonadota bacterium]|nr:MTH938/NDUFAF3 family protein [Pseudomonadota bacterium]